MRTYSANAVWYTPKGQQINAEISSTELCITNYGVTIDDKLLPTVLKPFVSSDGRGKGKGLGLYVAAYYSRLMGYGLKVDNIENGVQVKKVEDGGCYKVLNRPCRVTPGDIIYIANTRLLLS